MLDLLNVDNDLRGRYTVGTWRRDPTVTVVLEGDRIHSAFVISSLPGLTRRWIEGRGLVDESYQPLSEVS
jgi:hypothetical protein